MSSKVLKEKPSAQMGIKGTRELQAVARRSSLAEGKQNDVMHSADSLRTGRG